MINNDTNIKASLILAIDIPNHGLFKVHQAHLHLTCSAHSGWSIEELINRVSDLTGNIADYSDLGLVESLVILSYLTGGAAD